MAAPPAPHGAPADALPDALPDAPSLVDVPRPRRSLSPSRAADFMQCPLLYRLRVVDRLPEPPSAAAVRGTLVHAVLEQLFDAPAAERTRERAAALLPRVWAQLQQGSPVAAALFAAGAADGAGAGGEGGGEGAAAPAGGPGGEEERWLASAADLVSRWFELEDPTRLEPAERELSLTVPLASGLALRGIVDRLDVSPEGLLRVVDYKTGRSPGVGHEAKVMFQLRFYALALWRERGVVPALLQVVYLGDSEVLRHAPTAEELVATERKVEALWAAIERARTSGDWRPQRSRLCAWCPHQSLCPLFGGTPPPLPVPSAGSGAGRVSIDQEPARRARVVDGRA